VGPQARSQSGHDLAWELALPAAHSSSTAGPCPAPGSCNLRLACGRPEPTSFSWCHSRSLIGLANSEIGGPLVLAPETAQGASLKHQLTFYIHNARTTHTDVTDENCIRDSSATTTKPSKSQRVVDEAESNRPGSR
jgi:hypothetical protein